jgi:hypothetical protein
MAKRDRLALSAYQSVETYRDASGRCFIAYSNNASVFIRETRELIRFLRIAKGLPMRESLSDELLATGFGPEAFQDDEDPTANTKMIT